MMKSFLKTAVLLLVMIYAAAAGNAMSVLKMDTLIESADFKDTASIAVSVKNAQTGAPVYQTSEKRLLHPASALKLFTAYAALDTLGYDYEFKTQFYKSGNDLYIKLGADPLLTSAQLKSAFKKIKEEGEVSFQNLYFDDSVLDRKEFSSGWMIEDEISPYTPKVSSYNLDGNVIGAVLTPAADGSMTVSLKSKFPMSVISSIKAGEADKLEMARYSWINPDLAEVWGTVNRTSQFNIPISSMRRYFIFTVQNILEEEKINVKGSRYASKFVPDDAELIAEISNSIAPVLETALKNSSNLAAETIYKLAASKKYEASGTDLLAGMMFNEFYDKLGADTSDIVIKDGAGVSRGNLFSADWMTLALSKLYKDKNFEKFKLYAAQAGDGTLSGRLYDLRGAARLKTGSLSNVSSITGYVKSLDGNIYAVSVLIQNFTRPRSEIKRFEDEIIKAVYNK